MAPGQSMSSRVITGVLIVCIGLIIYYKYSKLYPTAEITSDTAKADKVIHQPPEELRDILGMTNWEDIKKEALANKKLKVTDGMISIRDKETLFRREVVDTTIGMPKGVFLLLHGMGMKSDDWLKLGTLHVLASFGYRMVALDLPGYGKSAKIKDLSPADLLMEVLKSLQVVEPGGVIIVSPSMAGSFALPLLFAHQEKFAGYVPIAPVGTELYKAADYNKIKVPTLIVYGDKDTNLGLGSLKHLKNIPTSEVYEMKGRGHGCYLEDPLPFHRRVHEFAKKVFAPK